MKHPRWAFSCSLLSSSWFGPSPLKRTDGRSTTRFMDIFPVSFFSRYSNRVILVTLNLPFADGRYSKKGQHMAAGK